MSMCSFHWNTHVPLNCTVSFSNSNRKITIEVTLTQLPPQIYMYCQNNWIINGTSELRTLIFQRPSKKKTTVFTWSATSSNFDKSPGGILMIALNLCPSNYRQNFLLIQRQFSPKNQRRKWTCFRGQNTDKTNERLRWKVMWKCLTVLTNLRKCFRQIQASKLILLLSHQIKWCPKIGNNRNFNSNR